MKTSFFPSLRSRFASRLMIMVPACAALSNDARANIYFDHGAANLGFATAANWSTDQLPSVGGTGTAFIGSGYDVVLGTPFTTSSEVQVGIDANPFGNNAAVPGGKASLSGTSADYLRLPPDGSP